LGRVELIHGKNADYILDGSHNPASFAPLMDIIKSDSRKKQLVFSCLADKDVETATNILCEGFDEVFIFPSSSYRAMQLPRIYAAFNGKCARVEECASIAECLQKTNAPLVVVCGTFTILKEAKEWIGKGL
jgi:folylpolyglutamate synthase/dihydropteroate synthase